MQKSAIGIVTPNTLPYTYNTKPETLFCPNWTARPDNTLICSVAPEEPDGVELKITFKLANDVAGRMAYESVASLTRSEARPTSRN